VEQKNLHQECSQPSVSGQYIEDVCDMDDATYGWYRNLWSVHDCDREGFTTFTKMVVAEEG
jgi:hypothetical protein